MKRKDFSSAHCTLQMVSIISNQFDTGDGLHLFETLGHGEYLFFVRYIQVLAVHEGIRTTTGTMIAVIEETRYEHICNVSGRKGG